MRRVRASDAIGLYEVIILKVDSICENPRDQSALIPLIFTLLENLSAHLLFLALFVRSQPLLHFLRQKDHR